MIVIELETLDKARVEHRGGRGTGCAASPADERSTACVVQRGDTLDALARDRKLGADEGTADTIEHQVLGMLADGGGNIVQSGGCKPGGQPAGGSFRVGGGPGTPVARPRATARRRRGRRLPPARAGRPDRLAGLVLVVPSLSLCSRCFSCAGHARSFIQWRIHVRSAATYLTCHRRVGIAVLLRGFGWRRIPECPQGSPSRSLVNPAEPGILPGAMATNRVHDRSWRD